MKTIIAMLCFAMFLTEPPTDNQAIDTLRNYVENNESLMMLDTTLPKLAGDGE